jgi:hypothetical protein
MQWLESLRRIVVARVLVGGKEPLSSAALPPSASLRSRFAAYLLSKVLNNFQ